VVASLFNLPHQKRFGFFFFLGISVSSRVAGAFVKGNRSFLQKKQEQ